MVNQLTLPADWVELLKLLTSRKVKFVITGGVAFSVHARARFTADLDLVVYPDFSNIEKFIQAFEEFGFSLNDRSPNQFLGDQQLLRVGVEPNMVDVMNFFKGADIDEVFTDAVILETGGMKLPFVSRDHLIANKLAVGRPRDIADVDELQKSAPKT